MNRLRKLPGPLALFKAWRMLFTSSWFCAAAGVFCQRWVQRQNAAKPVRPLLKVGVTKHQIILHEAAECLLAQQRVRDKRAGQDVALNGDRRTIPRRLEHLRGNLEVVFITKRPRPSRPRAVKMSKTCYSVNSHAAPLK